MTANDFEKIDQSAFLELARNLKSIAFRQPALKNFIGDITYPDQKIRPHALPNGSQNLQRKTHTIIEIAAESAVEFIGKRRPELIYQMNVGFKLQPVETGCLHSFCGICIIRNN